VEADVKKNGWGQEEAVQVIEAAGIVAVAVLAYSMVYKVKD
jgi:hypothetical protein